MIGPVQASMLTQPSDETGAKTGGPYRFPQADIVLAQCSARWKGNVAFLYFKIVPWPSPR